MSADNLSIEIDVKNNVSGITKSQAMAIEELALRRGIESLTDGGRYNICRGDYAVFYEGGLWSVVDIIWGYESEDTRVFTTKGGAIGYALFLQDRSLRTRNYFPAEMGSTP